MLSIANRLVRIGFDKEIAVALEKLVDIKGPIAKCSFKLDDQIFNRLVEEHYIYPVKIGKYKRYKVVDIKIILDRKVKEWRDILNDINLQVNWIKRDIKIHRGMKESRVKTFDELEEERAIKAANVERWKSDILNGVQRKGRLPNEIKKWMKENKIKRK